MTTKKSETLDQASNFIKEQHIDPLKDRMDVLEAFKADYERNFDDKVLCALRRNVDIQKEVKELVWQTVKDKIIYILLGAALTLGIAFAQGYLSQLGAAIAPHPAPIAQVQSNE